jgi:hypothetical protein
MAKEILINGTLINTDQLNPELVKKLQSLSADAEAYRKIKSKGSPEKGVQHPESTVQNQRAPQQPVSVPPPEPRPKTPPQPQNKVKSAPPQKGQLGFWGIIKLAVNSYINALYAAINTWREHHGKHHVASPVPVPVAPVKEAFHEQITHSSESEKDVPRPDPNPSTPEVDAPAPALVSVDSTENGARLIFDNGETLEVDGATEIGQRILNTLAELNSALGIAPQGVTPAPSPMVYDLEYLSTGSDGRPMFGVVMDQRMQPVALSQRDASYLLELHAQGQPLKATITIQSSGLIEARAVHDLDIDHANTEASLASEDPQIYEEETPSPSPQPAEATTESQPITVIHPENVQMPEEPHHHQSHIVDPSLFQMPKTDPGSPDISLN